MKRNGQALITCKGPSFKNCLQVQMELNTQGWGQGLTTNMIKKKKKRDAPVNKGPAETWKEGHGGIRAEPPRISRLRERRHQRTLEYPVEFFSIPSSELTMWAKHQFSANQTQPICTSLCAHPLGNHMESCPFSFPYSAFQDFK